MGNSEGYCASDPFPGDVPTVGVNLKVLRAIQQVVVSRDREKEWSTGRVVRRLIRPWTRWTKLSLAEHLRRKHTFEPHPQLSLVYDQGFTQEDKPAGYFLCHCWKNNFHELVDALERWLAVHSDKKGFLLDRNDTYFWVDFCVYNQWIKQPPPYQVFRNLLGKTIHDTVVVMAPWDKPLATQRIWCLWEMYCTLLSSQGTLCAALSTKESQHMKFACRANPGLELHLDATINVQLGKACMKRDRTEILEAFLKAQQDCCDVRAAAELKRQEAKRLMMGSNNDFATFLSAEKKKRTSKDPSVADAVDERNTKTKNSATTGSPGQAKLFSGDVPKKKEKIAAGWGEFSDPKMDPKEMLMFQPGFEGINERLNEFLREHVPRNYAEQSRQSIGKYEICWATKKLT